MLRRWLVRVIGVVLVLVVVLVPLLPFNPTVWTYASVDNSPSGDITLPCGIPLREAFQSGEWRVTGDG